MSATREMQERYTRVYESLGKYFLKVSINLWTVGVREADGVTGTGQVCLAEGGAELVSLAKGRGALN